MKTNYLKNFISLNIASLLGYLNFIICLYFQNEYKHVHTLADNQNFSYNIICTTILFIAIHLFLFLCWVLENDIKKYHARYYSFFKSLSSNKIYTILFYTGLILNLCLYILSGFFYYILLNIQVSINGT